MLIMIMAWYSWQSYQSILTRGRSQNDLYSRHILPWYWHVIWKLYWPSSQRLITDEHTLNELHWVRHKWPLVLLPIFCSPGQLVKAPLNLSLSRSNEHVDLFLQLKDFFDVRDDPVLGFSPPAVVTVFHTHVWEGTIDYRLVQVLRR